jgi:hypothetical protein
VAALGPIGCGEASSTTAVPADTAGAHVVSEGWRAALHGSSGAGSSLILDPEVPAAAQAAAASLDRVAGVNAGSAVAFELEGGDLPAAGVTIARRLSSPLPLGDTATLAYYDGEHDAWIAVPTQTSADRRTLSTTVHHLSIWNDIQYGAGWLLDRRVDAPECEGPRPSWIRGSGDVVVLDDKNAPLRWCTGHDPNHPDVLVVKVRLNRSYGVRMVPSVAPTWLYDGLFQSGPGGFLTEAPLRLSEAFHRPRPRAGETILLGGEEVDYGFTEAQVRSLSAPVLVRAKLEKPEAIAGLTYTALTKLAGDEKVLGRQVAAVVALVGIAQCASDIGGPLSRSDFGAAARGAFECLKDNGEDVGRATSLALFKALPKVDPKELGRIGGKVGGKLWQVWAAGEVFQIGTLLADSRLLSNAFELHAFPKFVPKPAPDLSHAQLTSTGIGPVRLGMTAADVRRLGIRLKVSTDAGFCDTWVLPGAEDVQLLESSDRLEYAAVIRPSAHAPKGVQPGDGVDKLKAAFGGELELIREDALGRDFYRVYGPDRSTTLQFSVDQKTGEVGLEEVGEPGHFYYPDGSEMCA